MKFLKDYAFLVGFIAILLIVLLIFALGGKSQNVNSKSDFNLPLEVRLNSSDTEASIEYSGGKKNKLEQNTSLYPSEKLQVIKNSALISGENFNLNINKLGEIRYDGENQFSFLSLGSDVWGETKLPIQIDMRNAKIITSKGSIFSLTQNDVASTIYVVAGQVEVQNLAGASVKISKGEKIAVMKDARSDKNADLTLSKEAIDDYIKTSDRFLENNGSFYLSQADVVEEDKKEQGDASTNAPSFTSGMLFFDAIFDGQQISKDTLDISGTFENDSIVAISFNEKNATINGEKKDFLFKDFPLKAGVNDIVYKVFNTNQEILYRGVLTLYNTSGGAISGDGNTPSNLAQTNNYPIKTSEEYKIITPHQNPYTTTESVVRIEGSVPSGLVTKIKVNDFQLQQFVSRSSYWQYFANSEFDNLKQGVNIYKIEFFGDGDVVLFENHFIIIKTN